MLATQYCVQMQKNIRNKQDELTQFIAIEKDLQDIDNYKVSRSIIRSKEKIILDQEKTSRFSMTKKNKNKNKKQ